MSKLEEALEKAKQLREASRSKEPGALKTVNREIQMVKVHNPYIVSAAQSDSPVSEEYRKLKLALISKTKADFQNTIIITSSLEGEGKSITAINLAIMLAQDIDHSVLLIDADLRKPMIHEYLGISYKYGLSDYLSSDIDISDILIKTGIGNLALLPAGHAVESPGELISSEKMKTLIKDVKHKYVDRYVIIDAPPVLHFTDTLSIGAFVDGVIFVVKEGYVQKKSVENALNLIKDLNILGAVFNSVSIENLDGYYSRYNYYKLKEYKSRENEKVHQHSIKRLIGNAKKALSIKRNERSI